jgi:hypothetical protein
MIRRVFTKDIGRYKKGQVCEWPKHTWDNVAKSAKAKSFDDFSRLVDMLEKAEATKPAA